LLYKLYGQSLNKLIHVLINIIKYVQSTNLLGTDLMYNIIVIIKTKNYFGFYCNDDLATTKINNIIKQVGTLLQ